MGTIKTNLSSALFTKGQQRLLGLLFGHPERSFYAKELIVLVNSGSGVVQRELAKLVAAGLITVRQVGNQKHYQANSATPIFSELRGIILKTCGLAEILQQALAPVTQQIQTAFIYGSIAKQQETSKSDIDLLIISDTLTYPDIFSLLETAEAQLARKINPNIYTSFDWQQKCISGNAFVSRISTQQKIYLIGKEDDKFKSG